MTEDEARLHYLSLIAAGWTRAAVAGHAELNTRTLSRWVNGRSNPYVAGRVAKIRPNTIAEKTIPGYGKPDVSRVGTVRRIQALLVMGWPHRVLSERVGQDTRLLLSRKTGRRVRHSTHENVCKMYRELSWQRGPSKETRRRALELGYAGPAEWDDIDHDEAPERMAS